MSQRAGRLRCNDCMVCKQCGKAQEHAKKFSTRHNYQQLCLACEPLQCIKCSRAQPRNVFPPCAVRNSRQGGRTQPLLCMSCRSAGYSARNLDAYPCRACHHSYGHSRFKEDDIRKYKTADNVSLKRLEPLCDGCAQRVKALKREVDRSSKRCVCKGAPIHCAKCPFYLQVAAWWPGGEFKTVTKDDKEFLDRANMPWWQNRNIPK